MTFPDGKMTDWLKSHSVQSSGLGQEAYDQHMASMKGLRLSLLREACNMLPEILFDALRAVRVRVAQDRLPLLSLVQADPLQLQSSHLSFQEFYAARAICEGTAISGSPPWQWEAWWANALRLGQQMGDEFGRGLGQAVGVEGDSLDLSGRLGGHLPTALQAVVSIMQGSVPTIVSLR